jgi:hypothetical protein
MIAAERNVPEEPDGNNTNPEPASAHSRTDQPADAAAPVGSAGVPPHEKPRENPPSAETPTAPHDRTLNFSLGFGKQLPNDVLSPEAVERLRSGGALSADDLEKLRAAAGVPGLVGSLLEAALPAADPERHEPDGADLTTEVQLPGDPSVVAVPGSVHRFEWTLGSTQPEREGESDPATYYEALTGRPDPMRGFFVTSRRILNVVTWIIALGIPVGLVMLGIVLRESTETIVLMGIAGLIVGMMFKVSFPRTPFG